MVYVRRDVLHGVIRSKQIRSWVTCRSAVQAGIIRYCMKHHTDIVWLGEHDFVRLEKAATATEQGVAVLERADGDVKVEFDLLVGADGVWSAVRRAAQDVDKSFAVRMTRQGEDFKSFQIDPGNVPMKVLRALQLEASKDRADGDKGGELAADATRTDIANSIRSTMECSICFFTHKKFRLFLGSQGSGNPWCGVLSALSERWDTLSQNSVMRESLAELFGAEDEQSINAIQGSLSNEAKLRSFGDVVWCSSVATGHIVLVGDAAHNINPILGQGLNSGLVDAYTLALYLSGQTLLGQRYQPHITFTGSQAPTDKQLRAWTESTRMLGKSELHDAVQAYSQIRTPETHGLVSMAQLSIWKATIPWFKPLRILDQVELALSQKFPNVYVTPFEEVRRGVSSYRFSWNKEVASMGVLAACVVFGLSVIVKLLM